VGHGWQRLQLGATATLAAGDGFAVCRCCSLLLQVPTVTRFVPNSTRRGLRRSVASQSVGRSATSAGLRRGPLLCSTAVLLGWP
jgi:hypothetical protein